MKGGFLGYLIISTEATALTSSWIHKIHVQLDGKSLSGKFPQTELNKQWKDIKESECAGLNWDNS